MEVSYGMVNDRLCCLIPSSGGELLYDIHEIPIKPRNNQQERKELLIQIVGSNAPINHTHIIKLAHELGSMAKRTIEKELENLEEEGLLESEKYGDSANAIRRWSIKPPESDFEKYAKKQVKEIIDSLDHYITTIEKSYNNFNPAKKAWAMTYLLNILHSYQPIIEIINQETRIKNEKRKFDSLAKRTYDILKYEERDIIDGRPILMRLLDLKASKPYIEMTEFLEEIK